MGGLTSVLRLFGYEKKKPPVEREARAWSNAELRKFASLYTGTVLNVSAWQDLDKEGRRYRDYFVRASAYATSNFEGWRGSVDGGGSYVLDLEVPLSVELVQAFDVVFNHTTLEHVYRVFDAFRNLCGLSRDTVILITPYLQHLHGPPGQDYWRFTPRAIQRLFSDNEFEVLYESAGMFRGGAYLFHLASRHPERWRERIEEQRIDPSVLKKVRLTR